MPEIHHQDLSWFQRQGHVLAAQLERLQRPPKPGAVLHRFADLRAGQTDAEGRTVTAVLSTEEPVERFFGFEILDHGADAVDLERAAEGLPMLWSHNAEVFAGRAVDVQLAGRTLRAKLRFGNSARAKELWDDVEAGLLTGVSIGYRIREMVLEQQEEDTPTYRVTKWEPFEASLVAIPADLASGVGRELKSRSYYSLAQSCPDQSIPRLSRDDRAELERLDYIESTRQHCHAMLRDWMQTTPDLTEAQREQCAELEQEIDQLAERHAAEPDSQSKALGIQVLERLQAMKNGNTNKGGGEPRPVQTAAEAPAVHTRQTQYRLSELVLGLSGDRSIDMGPYVELSRELTQRTGLKARHGGMLMPAGMMFRSLTAAGEGADMIQTNVLADQFIDVLRARSVVMQLGATVIGDLVGDASIPRKTAGTTGYWVNLDDTDIITESDVTLDGVTLTLKSVAGLTKYSHKMLKQATPGVDDMLRQDLAGTLAVALDKAAIQGSGAAGEPTGVVNTTGVNAATYTNGGSPTFANIVNLEGLVAADDVDPMGGGYVATPTLASGLKTTEKATGTGQFVWEPGQNGEGQMNGYRSMATNNCPAGTVVFGRWADLLIGTWGAVELLSDPYTELAKGNVFVRAIMDADIAVRYPQAFAVLTEAAA